MDQRVYDEHGNTVLQLATHTNQYQRGGSSDQQAADVPIIRASNGRRNEEEQQPIVSVDSSQGAGDHSSDDDKELAASIKNGVLIVCTFFATFCLDAMLNLPGGIKPEQLQSKPMNVTVGQLQKLQSFLNRDVSCFFISVVTIFLVTLASCFHVKYSLHIYSIMMGAVITSAALLFRDGLELATNDHLAHVAFVQGLWDFLRLMAILFVVGLLTTKEFWSYIRKECSKIGDLFK